MNPGAASQSREEDACWREAARLRSQFRGWVVIWLAAEGCFKAYRRLPGARRDTALSAATSAEMADLIGQVEQAARTPAPGARTPAPGARTPAPGARTPAPGTRTPAPGTEGS